jgi:Predicted ATPases of PP-loop superfamily
MKFVALISGGKDSIFNIMKCIENGHELVALVNLHPKSKSLTINIHKKALGTELDSYMYQSVGSENIEKIAECLGKPLFRRYRRFTEID